MSCVSKVKGGSFWPSGEFQVSNKDTQVFLTHLLLLRVRNGLSSETSSALSLRWQGGQQQTH